MGNFASDRPGTVTLAIAPGRGASLRRGGAPVPHGHAPQPDWEVLEIAYPELPWLVAQVAALAGYVQVLAPDDIRAEVAAALTAVLAAIETEPQRAGRIRPALDVAGASSQAQFARMLALVPWLARNDGVTVAQAAEHFGITAEQLLADLGSVITSGVDDWTLFDVQYWEPDGQIHMIDPLGLDEPLALAPDELLAVTVACEALAALPSQNADPVLGRVLAKLRAAAPHLQQVVDVRPDIPESIAGVVAEALAGGRTVELRYLAATRDEETERTVDPVQVVVLDGRAYLLAHCRRADAVRYFRLDRVLAARVGESPAREVTLPEPGPMVHRLAAGGRSALVDLSPVGQVLAERHLVTATWDLPDGWVRVQMPYGDPDWLAAMVLAGAGEVVVREPAVLVELVRARARAGLDRHETNG
jgi:proteasome accessory factor C